MVLLEKRTLGQGASSRAAGVVRTQGGTSWAVQLGEWSRRFYLGQHEELGIDSGFTPQGYLLPCFTEADVAAAHARMAMQNALGLPVRWLEPDEVDRLNPTLAPGLTRGGTFNAEDGYLTPPRNVTAYAVALAISGVVVSEHTAFTGVVTSGDRVTGVRDQPGPDRQPARWCSPAGPSWPRSAAWPGSGSRPAGCGTRWRSPSRIPTWIPPGCRWSSTWPPACTGGPRRRACCSA